MTTLARSLLSSLAVVAGLLLGACGDVGPLTDAAVEPLDASVDAPPPLPLGASCDDDDACGSGVCASGVCCATACEGACVRCDLPAQRGTCAPVGDDVTCGVSACDEGQARPAPHCDGAGACVQGSTTSCGAYVCADELACAASCTDDSACSAGNVCVSGSCMPPTCDDGVRTAPETGVDCGGGTCPRCVAGLGCAAGSDCQSGTCDATTNTCTTPTYTWRTSSFGACGAGACSVGVQTRTVWCQRSDGATVDDALCGGGRPAQSQTCTNTAGCTWYAGAYGACSARCDGGTMTRPVYCRDGVGAQVPSAWCSGTAPSASATCNPQACTVYVVSGPSAAMGPCWSPPNCLGGYPAYASCPAGYAATRSEMACGNPNSCGGNWALCTFFNVAHYGCSNPTYVMGITARECTYQ